MWSSRIEVEERERPLRVVCVRRPSATPTYVRPRAAGRTHKENVVAMQSRLIELNPTQSLAFSLVHQHFTFCLTSFQNTYLPSSLYRSSRSAAKPAAEERACWWWHLRSFKSERRIGVNKCAYLFICPSVRMVCCTHRASPFPELLVDQVAEGGPQEDTAALRGIMEVPNEAYLLILCM